jgi:hypothetical protein
VEARHHDPAPEFAADGSAVPVAGDVSIVTGADGTSVAIIEIVEVQEMPFAAGRPLTGSTSGGWRPGWGPPSMMGRRSCASGSTSTDS